MKSKSVSFDLKSKHISSKKSTDLVDSMQRLRVTKNFHAYPTYPSALKLSSALKSTKVDPLINSMKKLEIKKKRYSPYSNPYQRLSNLPKSANPYVLTLPDAVEEKMEIIITNPEPAQPYTFISVGQSAAMVMSKTAKNFAKFAMRGTPKNALKAFSSCSSKKAFGISSKPASVPRLASLLSPIPPTISGAGSALPITTLVRGMVTSANNQLTEGQEEISSLAERVTLGSAVEAGEELEALMSKIMSDSSLAMSCREGVTVIVDFHASWCGPCRVLGPLLESEVANSKKSILLKVDVDAAPNVAAKYNISSLPTVKAFKNGKEIDSFIGSRNKAFVSKFIESAISK
ncbi:hypothetical protein HDV06_005480 [Boothiomyces sp. JEL0866]|nr:hypothetical protein HDV06_005480 [Boothiomyces sp. JEL0866]